MIEMVKTMAIPASTAAGISTSAMEGGLRKLEQGLHTMENAGSPYEMSKAARVVRLETMEELRDACDEAESKVPAGTWPIASYMSLLFLDFTEKYKIPM